MKFIILTEQIGEDIYIVSSKIVSLQKRISFTYVTLDTGCVVRVLETPDQIIELINQQEPT